MLQRKLKLKQKKLCIMLMTRMILILVSESIISEDVNATLTNFHTKVIQTLKFFSTKYFNL